MQNENVRVRLPSNCNVDLSKSVYEECYCNFTERQFSLFNNIINSGLYFPQIVQFAYVMIGICKGNTSFKEIFLCNVLSGTIFTLCWFLGRLYTIPGLSYLSCFIGSYIFRLFLHFIPISIVSLFVIKDWKVILYCLVCGLVTTLIKTILFSTLSTVKYNDKAAIYATKIYPK